MNKIPGTIATISQYISPERMRLGIPLLNCPKESAPMTNSRNKLPIPFPNAPKKMLQSLRKTGERIAVNSVVVMLYTCPSCGKTFRLDYSTLYHQMEDLIMIYLVSESEVEKTYEMFYGAVDIDNMYEFASSHCNDFKDLRDDDEIVINREWILNKLVEAENE